MQQVARADVVGADHRAQVVEEDDERLDATPRRTRDAGVVGPAQGLHEPDAQFGSERVELGDAGVADAALGHVEHALDADLVGRVDDRPQVGHGVLDLAPVVEARATDDLVGHAEAHHGLLDDAALGVGAVEHGELAPVGGVVVVQLARRRGDERCLVAFVLGVVAGDAVAAAGVGPQVLRLARGVVGDDRVGGIEDRLRAAVVLVEHDGRHLGEGFLELQDVPEVGAAEAIDRLVRVSDDGDVVVAAGEQQDDLVLRLVRVLVLVDQDVLEALAVVVEHVGVVAEQADGVHQQVVEVHRPGLVQPSLVLGIDVGVLAVEDVLRPGCDVGGGEQLVLPQADQPVHAAGCEALGVEVQVADHVAREPHRVGLVVDRELAGIPERVGIGAQHPHARRVERAHPHRPGDRPDEGGDALAHLVGCLVGERDGEDP